MKFKSKYSLDNGLTWIQIADNIGGTSYSWGVPKPLGNKRKCLIRVVGYNKSGAIIGKDISNAPFTIEVVRVESPNGGENLKSGSTWTIMWRTYETVTSVATTELGYKTEGTDWKLTRTFTGNPGSYDVKVPYVTSPQKGMVAVRLKDSSGNVLGTDTSDTFFTIQP